VVSEAWISEESMFGIELEFKDLLLIKLYFQSEFTRRYRAKEFQEVLRKYDLTEEQAKQIAAEELV
jgi:hypothetical protein